MSKKLSKLWPMLVLALSLCACAKNADMMGMGAGSGAATTIDNSVGGDGGASGNAATKKDDSSGEQTGKVDNGPQLAQGTVVVDQHSPGNDGTVPGPVYDFPHHSPYSMHFCASVISANPLGTFKIRIRGYLKRLVSNVSGQYEPCCTGKVMRIRYNSAPAKYSAKASFKYYDVPMVQNDGVDGYFDTKEDLTVSDEPDFSFYWMDNQPSVPVRTVSDCNGALCLATLQESPEVHKIDNLNIDYHEDFIGGLPNCDSEPLDSELRGPALQKANFLQPTH